MAKLPETQLCFMTACVAGKWHVCAEQNQGCAKAEGPDHETKSQEGSKFRVWGG